MKKYYTKNNMVHVVEYGKSDVYTYPHEECKWWKNNTDGI